MALKEKMQIHSGHRLAYVHTYVNLIIIDLLHFYIFSSSNDSVQESWDTCKKCN